MGKNSKIQWTTHTTNFWRGCTIHSPACDYCYAMAMAKRNPAVLGVWGDDGTRVVASEAKFREPYHWDKQAAKEGERHRVFADSMSDFFEDWQGPMIDSHGSKRVVLTDTGLPPATMDNVRAEAGRVIRETPNLDWLLCTKRPENAAAKLARMWGSNPEAWPSNYWLGATVENQEMADLRIPQLIATTAPIRWLSMEPLLGPVDLASIACFSEPGEGGEDGFFRDYLNRRDWHPDWECGESWSGPRIDWVIVGFESGPQARPGDLDWIRSIRDQCQAAGVPVFIKQLGSVWAKANKAKDGHGGDWSEWSPEFRVREFPKLAEVAR